MVDVNPLPFRMPPEPPSKKTDRTVDADAFHKEMHKKVEKVSETDQEQKKKRKRQEESEEEDEPKEAAAPTTPPSQITPFSMDTEKKKVSPLGMEGGGKISPLASAQPTQTPSTAPPQSPMMSSSFSSDEMEDDSGLLEETAYLESMPEESEAPPTYATPQAPAAPAPTSSYEEEMEPPTPPSAGRVPMPEVETPAAPKTMPVPEEKAPASQTQGSSEKKKTKTQAPPAPTAPAPALVSKPKKAPAPAQQQPQRAERKPKAPALPEEKPAEKVVSAEDIEEMERVEEQTRSDDTAGYFEQYVKEKDKGLKKEVRPTETPAELEDLEGTVTPVTPLPPSDYIEKEKKDEEEVAALGAAGGSPGLEAPPPSMAAATPPVMNPYANLHPEVMELFDRMVGTMTVMSHSGVKETVVSLDSPKFASSVFFGSQIIIQEYATAPQAYNIQLNGSPEALALFQGNAEELMAAFQYGNYNFRVNRLDTGLLGQKPLIRRKGPPSGGKEDKRGSER